ncbi:hypothetical protein F5Y04DRAFT_259730 [Hypomontagnella monticulosa]|nr:hypothetical protein F5Y04DRAFT_259730 [Hypomontagnella monticulosa]
MCRAVPASNNSDTISSSEAKFHYFNLLPLELRREIYIFATPPRFVHVEEYQRHSPEWEEKRDEFREKCRTFPVQFKLSPDIAYFAHNWNSVINRSLRSNPQLPLEAYGFTSVRSRYQPWVPTGSAPEIPPTWLTAHPDIAWDMTRDAMLISKATIPVFLHVCSESRGVLKSYGYQLSFSTRTHGPCTWFHFERDTLYLNQDAEGYDFNLLSGGKWDVGMFRPADLRRVRKLAISKGSDALDRYKGYIPDLIRLFPNLSDFFLMERTSTVCSDTWEEPEDPGNDFACIPMDEIDALMSMSRCPWCNRAFMFNSFRRFKRRQKESAAPTDHSFFRHVETNLERFLHSVRERVISNSRSVELPLWNIPRVWMVQICPQEEVQNIFAARRRVWAQYCDTKRRLARGGGLKPRRFNAMAVASSTYRDVGEAYLSANVPGHHEEYEFFENHIYDARYRCSNGEFTLPVTVEEFWWLTEAVVFPPRFDVY